MTKKGIYLYILLEKLEFVLIEIIIKTKYLVKTKEIVIKQ